MNANSNSTGTSTGNAVSNAFNPDETRPGSDLGVVLMAFPGAFLQ